MQTNTQPSAEELRFAVLAVDTVIFTIRQDQLSVLLIKAAEGPYAESWVLPGGLVKPTETLEQAVERHLLGKANISDVYCEQLYTFGQVDRDPRGRVVSVAYFTLVSENKVRLKTSPGYTDIQWFSVNSLPKLGYDHDNITKVAIDRLQAKLEYTNIVYSLLTDEFTLSDLQQIYEIILERKLDKRNFRRKILSLHIISSIDKLKKGDANRPAQLFRFIKRTPQLVEVI